MKISIDSLKPIYKQTFRSINNPTHEDLLAMINLLDQKTHSILTIEKGPLDKITIGGGPDMFILFYQTDYDRFPTLINPLEKSIGTEKLIIGGQMGEFEKKTINIKNTIFEVSLKYFNGQEFFNNYSWI